MKQIRLFAVVYLYQFMTTVMVNKNLMTGQYHFSEGNTLEGTNDL